MVAESCAFDKEHLSLLATATVNSLSHEAAAGTKLYILINYFNIL